MNSAISDEIITNLKARVDDSFIPYSSPFLEMVGIRNSICFLACNAYHKLARKRLKIKHIINNMIYCEDFKGSPIDIEEVQQLTAMIESQISEKYIGKIIIPKENVVQFFAEKGHTDTVEIIKSSGKTEIECACLGKYIQTIFGPFEFDLSRIKAYRLHPVDKGFIIELPGLLDIKTGKLPVWKEVPRQHYIIQAIEDRFRSINCRTFPQLNAIVENHRIPELNRFNESYHKIQFDSIFKKITENPNKRVISIAGASSSGKSTFAHILLEFLIENGYPSLIFSMDNYFVNRLDTPLDEDGKYDFESVYSLQLHLMADRIKALLMVNLFHVVNTISKLVLEVILIQQFNLIKMVLSLLKVSMALIL